MTSLGASKPLDEALWASTALGIRGPRTLISRTLSNEGNLYYYAFWTHHLKPPPLSPEAQAHVSVLRGRRQMLEIHPVPEVSGRHLHAHTTVSDDDWLGAFWMERESSTSGFLVARPWEPDNRVAWLQMFWLARRFGVAGARIGMAGRSAIFYVLVHELARAGFVAVLASYEETGLGSLGAQRLRSRFSERIPLLQSARTVLEQHGLLAGEESSAIRGV